MDITMNQWEYPDSYVGFDPVGDYGVLGVNRDSDALTRSNWITVCKELGAVAFDGGCGGDDMVTRPNVYTWRAGHWACGWVEYLMVRQDAPQEIIEQAQEIVDALADYPVYDEDHFSQLELDETMAYWDGCSIRERVDMCRDAGESIFAARHGYPPERVEQRIRDC